MRGGGVKKKKERKKHSSTDSGRGKTSSTVRLMLPSRGSRLDDFSLQSVKLAEVGLNRAYKARQTNNSNVKPQRRIFRV